MSDLNLRNQGEFLNALHLFSLFDNKGLKLNEPESLLQEWSKGYQTEDKAHYSFYSLLAPSEFEARIKEVCNDLKVRYALSGLSGAFRLVPFVRYHRVNLYLEDKEINGHKEIVIKATRQILLEVFKLLENFHESLILVGGWVPIMIIPEAEDKHVGTLDVDLVINDKSLHETGSETIIQCVGKRLPVKHCFKME